MLRIRTFDETHAVTLKLEGKVVRAWVAEARRAWLDARNGKKLIIDLLDVTFVDDAGRELLAEMHAAGTSLIGSGPMIRALLDEIQVEKPLAKPSRSGTLLFSMFALLMIFAKTNLWKGQI
jgi:anti-anti-sigma regulatory factor